MSIPYQQYYNDHLKSFRQHLKGVVSQSTPFAHWTADEIDLFFHSLAVHSRIRPDLIAESIPSKSLSDVCAYLNALDTAAQAHEHASRTDLPIAMSVSEAWVAFEEDHAAQLVRREKNIGFDERDEPGMDARIPAVLDTLHLQALNKLLRDEAPATSVDPSRDPSPSSSRAVSPDPVDSRALSPASRRRINNRLRMRQRRAAASGMAANLETSRLQPGRKPTKVYVPKVRAKTYTKYDKLGTSVEPEGDNVLIKPSGLHAGYRVLKDLRDSGLGPESLAKLGFDMFNFKRLETLVGEHHTITKRTIHLLQEILVDFTADVLFHTILLHEQDVTLKGGKKVWRAAEDGVDARKIIAALEIKGFRLSPDHDEQVEDKDLEMIEEETPLPVPSPVWLPASYEALDEALESESDSEWAVEIEEEIALDDADRVLENECESGLWQTIAHIDRPDVYIRQG
ncbi:unnamed protein product [Mycena citricolor]|uniref:Uncharacterized protein n=1 Tax=Mycena citricolor TaxID=2018698 RepID=A0AAD2K6G4_9AGAR|nr:unnamed protein product [Mycena citricolor]